MRNTFYFAYYGNKRNEIKEFINLIDFDKFETIVEPFGGSLAFSRYCYNLHPNKTYYISDSDIKITEFCNRFHLNKSEIIKKVEDKANYFLKMEDKTTSKLEWKKYINEVDSLNTSDSGWIEGYFFKNKIYSIRLSLFPFYEGQKRYKYPINLQMLISSNEDTDLFFKNNKYLCQDFRIHLEKVKDDPKSFVFLDPPYPIDSECSWYKDKESLNTWTYLIDYFDNCKCKYIMILNSNVFMDIIFKNKIKHRYFKMYCVNARHKDENGNFVKKTAEHLVISNID